MIGTVAKTFVTVAVSTVAIATGFFGTAAVFGAISEKLDERKLQKELAAGREEREEYLEETERLNKRTARSHAG